MRMSGLASALSGRRAGGPDGFLPALMDGCTGVIVLRRI